VTRDRLRVLTPSRAGSAERGSKAAAIKLFCMDCMGGSSKDALACESRDCWLWEHWLERRRRGA